ncbi:MAG: UDP-N-acetylmuramate--L-alanine ligase [Fibrobacter sp.]|jgi:UDP-N-acetylmuramate--alanine ligase|uniref:UDP-N-acetylmuramate--L-alanine ligase n=1 Tax=uncultured Fibrobacter sp. TaxID=261512 RepID=UPI001562FBC5|nr:UDP-N-acetylmuramate--L-alanine ligase [uncultured Fibrobacter sp.]MBQ1823809.1 UDP-N-acetylmuramate--L-alanine ligase [Fibrobacter sp.]MBR6317752.1 UDP-N-acetylmuramate--L-alanine ligase [Fibrobacter sp.]
MQINDCKRVRRLHFVGIGGAGMSGIAEVLYENGFEVTGSDMGEGQVIDYLKGLGIRVDSKHEAKNVENADLVVYSSAIPHDNPELVEARNRRIPVIRRAEMLGELMRLKYTLAICGTHGKTTTTSIVGQIWEEAGLDPTIIVGGVVKGKGSGAKVGRGDYLIAESDEFDRSFLSMMPSSAIVTNIDADHLDTYENIEEIKDAFVQFVNKIPFYGQAILCLDDANVQSILSRVRKPLITYGFSRQAKYRIDNLRFEKGFPVFDILNDGESLGEFRLKIPGRHNVLNATAAVALAMEEGIAPDVARKACAEFEGVTRRFEFMGEKNGVMVFNDYAHHPTEATATLLGFREAFPDKRIVVAFQPHLFSRTRDQHEAFGMAFANCDVLLVTDIYPARERPIEGVTGALVANSATDRGHRNARFVGDQKNLLPILKEELRKDDVVVLMGAGNVYKLGTRILEECV